MIYYKINHVTKKIKRKHKFGLDQITNSVCNVCAFNLINLLCTHLPVNMHTFFAQPIYLIYVVIDTPSSYTKHPYYHSNMTIWYVAALCGYRFIVNS